jgi:hypothetical protein
MDDYDITLENPHPDRQSDVDNQRVKTSIPNRSNSEGVFQAINKAERTSMQPIPLYILFFLCHAL